MRVLRRLRRWCPQPKNPASANFARLSSHIIAGVLFVEIVALLIAPLTYLALFPPHVNYSMDQTFPLTNSQIKSAWPNLPTAKEIENNEKSGGAEYSEVVNNSLTGSGIVNCTLLNSPALMGPVAFTPKIYDIYVYAGNASWIAVPETYLATNHPPSMPSSQEGFFNTGLSSDYVFIAVMAIVATSAIGITYLRLNRKKRVAIL